jgi:hypothetical protein
MRRRGTVYAPAFENEMMYEVFPKPSKVKPFRRNDFKDNPERGYIHNPVLDLDKNYMFAFRGEFEKCGRAIDGDIIYYSKKRQRRKKKAQEKHTRYHWDEFGANWEKKVKVPKHIKYYWDEVTEKYIKNPAT